MVNRFVFYQFFTTVLGVQENQVMKQRATTISMRTDVNAPVHMHMSHSYLCQVGLNCDDKPKRHNHNRLRHGGKKWQTKDNKKNNDCCERSTAEI